MRESMMMSMIETMESLVMLLQWRKLTQEEINTTKMLLAEL